MMTWLTEVQVRGRCQPGMEGYHLCNLRWGYNCLLTFHDHILKIHQDGRKSLVTFGTDEHFSSCEAFFSSPPFYEAELTLDYVGEYQSRNPSL